MRSFILASAFAAVTLAQSSSVTSTPSYSNPATAYLTQTDSRGVVTGMPSVNTDVGTANSDVGAAETSIAALPSGDTSVNMIPAGLPTGIQTVTIGNGTVTASINNSTTVVLTAASTTRPSGVAGGTGGSGSGSVTSPSSSSSSSTSTAAAAHVKVAGGALAGAAGLIAAFL